MSATAHCPGSWQHRLWPSPQHFDVGRAHGRLPETLVVALGSTNDYMLDAGRSMKSTNPVLFAKHVRTGQRVVLKLKRRSITRTLENDKRIRTQEVRLAHEDARTEKEHTGGVYSVPWAKCTTKGACPSAAVKRLTLNGVDVSTLRRLPYKTFEYSHLNAAVGLGSMKHELFISAMLAASTHNSSGSSGNADGTCVLAPGIVPLLDVLEFSPGAMPDQLEADARKFHTSIEKELVPLPPNRSQYVYALVFPQLEPSLSETILEQRDEMRAYAKGLLTALVTAHSKGIINFDLRYGHMFKGSDGTYRLIDFDCAFTTADAAGLDPAFPRNDGRSCAASLPAVPESFWGELVEPRPLIAPEILFPWLSKGVSGCRFTPAIDTWHAGLVLAKNVLGCVRGNMGSQSLLGLRADNHTNPKSLLHGFANTFGTDRLYSTMDKYGWTFGKSCAQICKPMPGPLTFTRDIIRDCERTCARALAAHGRLVKRTHHLRGMTFEEWCGLPEEADSDAREAMDMISRMIVLDPARRLSPAEALLHPFFGDGDLPHHPHPTATWPPAPWHKPHSDHDSDTSSAIIMHTMAQVLQVSSGLLLILLAYKYHKWTTRTTGFHE